MWLTWALSPRAQRVPLKKTLGYRHRHTQERPCEDRQTDDHHLQVHERGLRQNCCCWEMRGRGLKKGEHFHHPRFHSAHDNLTSRRAEKPFKSYQTNPYSPAPQVATLNSHPSLLQSRLFKNRSCFFNNTNQMCW